MKGKRTPWFWIVLGVMAFHLGLFWLLSGKRPVPEYPKVPRQNFAAYEEVKTDEATGETVVERHIVVSTKLAPPVRPEVSPEKTP